MRNSFFDWFRDKTVFTFRIFDGQTSKLGALSVVSPLHCFCSKLLCSSYFFLWFFKPALYLHWLGVNGFRSTAICFELLFTFTAKRYVLWAMKRKGLHFNATRFLREHFSHISVTGSVLPSLFELNFNAGKTHVRAQAHCSPMNFTMFFCHTQHSCWKFDEWSQVDSLLDGNKQEIYLK